MKTCTKCGECKPLELFPKLTRAKDGRRERCRTCHAEDTRAYKQTDTAKAARKSLYERTKNHVLQQSRDWYKANKARRVEASKRWVEANRKRVSYNARQYQLRRINSIPPWADEAKTEAVYAEARALRELGVDAEVDHIIPLRGKHVSGLHWHGNLRLLLAWDNRRKSNRLLEGHDLACP